MIHSPATAPTSASMSFPHAMRRVLAIGLAAAVCGCASLAPSHNEPQGAIARSDDTTLGRLAKASLPDVASTGFRALPQSRFSMDARLALAAKAERSLDLQYYLLQNDATGRQLLRAVRDASRRGVRVRILVDDLYTAQSDRLLDALDAYPGVEIRVFNPFPVGRSFAATRWTFSLFDFARVNHRMHNKLFIADGAFAVFGGRNIADEYFFQSREGNFVDFDLVVAGQAVGRLQSLFDLYWNSPRVYKLSALERPSTNVEDLQRDFDARAGTATPFSPPASNETDFFGRGAVTRSLEDASMPLLPARVDVFADDPEKVSGRSETGTDDTTVTSRVLSALRGARSEVVLISPYFVPGANGIRTIEATCARGVKVTLVTNTLAANDEPYVSVAYARYRQRMLKAGVDIYEISSARLKLNHDVAPILGTTIGRSHAKLIVIDHRVTFVGSMNMDLRSSRENTEIGSFVDSKELADEVLSLVGELRQQGTYRLRFKPGTDDIQWVAVEDGHETVSDDEPEVDFATRLKSIFIGPFISEGLL